MLAKAKNDHANIKTIFLWNLLLEKNMGYLHEISWKKMFCAKKVTKLPDLTVASRNFIYIFLFHKCSLKIRLVTQSL